MRRLLVLLPLVASVLVVGGARTVAGADVSGRLHATVTTNGLEAYDLTAAGCTHSDATTGRCAIPIYETDVFSGDLVGQEQNVGGLSVTVPDFVGWASTVATYSGSVKGCPGPGTAVFRYVFKMGATPGVAAATPGHNYGTVEVVPGSGTGGLATLKGHGTDVADTTNGVVSNAVLDFSCGHDHG